MRRQRRRGHLRIGMQSMPHLHEERTLITKRHVVPLAIMDLAQTTQRALDFPWTILTLHDMTVDDIERLRRIGHGLDAAGEEATGTMYAEAMATCQAGKAHLETSTAAETIGFGEDARLHLTQ